MDKPTVYIETSIVSYLAANPSRDPVTARNQRLTHEWWNIHRHRYTLYTSALTRLEAARGDPVMSHRRLAMLTGIPAVASPSSVVKLAGMLHKGIPLPYQASADAEHIALAAVNGMTYLLTWDRKHISNPRLKGRIEAILGLGGYTSPVFCTPAELTR